MSYVIQETSPARNIPSINNSFGKVLVMAEYKKVKENPLGLLQRIANLSKGIADLSTLVGF